ncbi:MAG: hypothetical protein HQ502_20010 [Alphaproteobacteria bacterium]|nr:hypothetical protein [Alphaproteobacteria bacterium]
MQHLPVKALPKDAECLLCRGPGPRQDSHVIPAFAFRGMRKTSATGHIRTSQNPNRRVQDGQTDFLLCSNCEALFSKYEKMFSEKIFTPLIYKGKSRFLYGPWLLKFAASISWRVLAYHREHAHEMKHKVIEDWCQTDAASEAWRNFLLGNCKNSGKFTQHIVFFDQIVESKGKLPDGLHSYLLRSIDMDVMATNTTILTYSKIMNCAIFGFVKVAESYSWKGSKIGANSGIVGDDVVIDEKIFDWIVARTGIHRNALATISNKQTSKIDETARKRGDAILSSGTYRAMRYDRMAKGPRR